MQRADQRTLGRAKWLKPRLNGLIPRGIRSPGAPSSPQAAHCYAMEMAKRLEAVGIERYVRLTRKTGKRTVWNGVVREVREALSAPYGWKKPRKIFVNSMTDLFHERVSDAFILDVWKVMRETPHHNY
jgi:protein gp37